MTFTFSYDSLSCQKKQTTQKEIQKTASKMTTTSRILDVSIA